MGRWEPDARGRLERAALDLYVERGYEQTTVAEIAHRAGLTERTYFRHFADKREVLFSGSADLATLLVGAVEHASAATAPIDVVVDAVASAGGFFDARHDHARRRHAVVSANPELRERELIKMATLSAALSAALRGRGVDEPDASLAAETGVAVFTVAFGRWIVDEGAPDLARHVRETFARLRSLIDS